MSPNIRSISEAAKEINCLPRDISDAFYLRLLDDSRCFTIGNRRVIPDDYLPEVRRVMQERGKIRQPETVS